MPQLHVARVITAAIVAALVIGCSGNDGSPPPRKVPVASAPVSAQKPLKAGTGSIVGTVSFAGGTPVAAELNMDADPLCASAHTSPVTSEDIVVDASGGLKDVFVYVRSGHAGDYPVPASEVVLDQKGCVYEPHAIGLRVGQPLVFLNSDSSAHNVHSLSDVNPSVNKSMPLAGMRLPPVEFDAVEIFKVKCEVHPWMAAYIGVFDSPFFAVTGSDGSFALSGLPPGSYTVVAHHGIYGPTEAEVVIGGDDGDVGTADFSFGG